MTESLVSGLEVMLLSVGCGCRKLTPVLEGPVTETKKPASWYLATHIHLVASFSGWVFIWTSLNGLWCIRLLPPAVKQPVLDSGTLWRFFSVSWLFPLMSLLCFLLSLDVVVGMDQSLIPGDAVCCTLHQFPLTL